MQEEFVDDQGVQIVEHNIPEPEASTPAEAPAQPAVAATQTASQTVLAAAASEVHVSSADVRNMISYNYEETPITDIVNTIILEGIKKGASDLHFDPHEQGLKIRIRIDGTLMDYSLVPLYVQKNMVTRIKIIAGMNITESRTPQDGAIKSNLEDMSIDLRVSSLPTNLGEKVVIRVMDYSMSEAGLDKLGLSEENLDKIYRIIAQPHGIILVTGATGSGKSTTVYAMLQKLNTQDRNVITVEDPVEMNIEGINQVQVISEIGLNFATVLRSILRQDPDTIMIGEIRDDETARIAVRASITGHLVLSTIHTNSALNTIERLLDMEVERYLLGAALSGIISQTLARKLCMKCRIERPANDYEKSVFKKALPELEVGIIFAAGNCEHCNQGYSGRVAIHEVLMLNQAIRDAISKNVEKEDLRKLVYESGTITMLQDGLKKVASGITTFEEIIKIIELDDDLGTNTNLGLSETLEDSQVSNENRDYDTLD